MTANVNKILPPPHGIKRNLLMFNKLAVLFCLIFLFNSFAAFSQGSNSVNISILGCGNYSAKLSDYYSPKNAGMLTVIVRNTDFKDPYLQIQLYMSVTNNLKTYIQTKSPNTSKIFQLYAGEVLTLTGQDLECIFNTYYLNYNKSNFQDGQNILKIYARDVKTGKIVSNTAQILLKSVMIAPPKLTSPDENFTIETDNQFFNFAWRGDNGGANIATRCNYRYKFELWKQNFSDKNVESQRPADFTAENLFDEKYQFLLATFPFEIGQKYCWRVTAYDPFEKATFLQNGRSEVRTFIFKHLPVPVTGLKHTINERNRQATVTWNAAEGHTKYYVEYYNPQTTKTIAMEKDEPKFTLASAPETEYTILFRVKAQCWGDDSRCSDWSDWDTIKYAAPEIVESKYPCGYKFPDVEITNFELKSDFQEGDIVSEANGSSEYEIINCKSDGNGVLEGQFYLIMNAWGGAKIACDFWDTKINTDNVIITTRYRSIDVPGGMIEPEKIAEYVKELWQDGNSALTSSKIKDTIVIDQKFDYLYRRENGDFVAVIVNDDGSITETDVYPYKTPAQTLITDGQGDSVVVSQKGQVMGIKEYRATGGNRALLNDYHRKSDSLAQWKINFLPDTATQIYGFDYLGSGNHGIYSGSEYYPYLSANYDLRYKSIECYKNDKVIVDFGSYPEKDSVIFKDKYGVTLKLSKGNVLNFTGVAKTDTNYIYAYRGDQKIGKLSVNTYKQKTYKVVFVRVNGAAKKLNAKEITKYLNKVYSQCAVSFEDSIDDITIGNLTSFSHGGSGILTVYNDDQKKVLQAYDPQMQDGVYYLFFIDNVTDKKDGNGTLVSGYMPRGYNAGFIYDGGSEHTIAHEIGHGIAGLEHVFENSNNSGKTANLMDYSSGEELWHFQWDAIQDPSRVWMKWSKDESEGEWTTDGHYYLFTYLGMLMEIEPEIAERLGSYAEKPDTYVLHDEDIKNGKIILGKEEEIDLQKFIVPEGYVLKAGSFNIARNNILQANYNKFYRDGYYFFLTKNLYEWPEHTITAEDKKRGYIDFGADKYGNPKRISFHKAFKAGDMMENITWLIGGLQQKYHALTEGFHGVELAATAYAIDKFRNSHKEDYEGYLLHRFGDVFAHMDMEDDKDGFVYKDISLMQYISVLDNYFKQKLSHIIYDKSIDKIVDRSGKVNITVKTSLTEDEIIWRMLQSIFKAKDDEIILDLDPEPYFIKSSFSYDKIKEEILTKLKKELGEVPQLDNEMYGDEWGFTFGHGWDGTPVDDILNRLPLFEYYVNYTIQLFDLLGLNENNITYDDDIKPLITAIEQVAGEKTDLKLDGIFALHIYLERIKRKEKIESFNIPVKNLSKQIKDKDVAAIAWYDTQTTFNGDPNNLLDQQSAKLIKNFLDSYFEVNREKFDTIEKLQITYENTNYKVKVIRKK